MEYTFFYGSIFVIIVLTFILGAFKKQAFPKIIIGITTVGYSLISDIFFGVFYKLFHYISPQESLLYIVLSAVFIYPFLNILYVLFLPRKNRDVAIYTFGWIIGLLLFEYFTVITKTLVFTGWQPFPWSVVVYIVAYTWIYFFYKYLLKKTSS